MIYPRARSILKERPVSLGYASLLNACHSKYSSTIRKKQKWDCSSNPPPKIPSHITIEKQCCYSLPPSPPQSHKKKKNKPIYRLLKVVTHISPDISQPNVCWETTSLKSALKLPPSSEIRLNWCQNYLSLALS